MIKQKMVYVHKSFATAPRTGLSVSKRAKDVIVAWLFLMMPRACLQFVIVVFPDHTHLLYLCKLQMIQRSSYNQNPEFRSNSEIFHPRS